MTDEPIVTSTIGVCGGAPCIRGTRIPIRIIIQFRDRGMSDDQIIEQFPSLSRKQLAAVWELERGMGS